MKVGGGEEGGSHFVTRGTASMMYFRAWSESVQAAVM